MTVKKFKSTARKFGLLLFFSCFSCAKVFSFIDFSFLDLLFGSTFCKHLYFTFSICINTKVDKIIILIRYGKYKTNSDRKNDLARKPTLSRKIIRFYESSRDFNNLDEYLLFIMFVIFCKIEKNNLEK